MSNFVIWLDQAHTKIFEFSRERMERKNIYSDLRLKIDQIDLQRQERKYFSEIYNNISQASKLLLLGPGITKHHFQNYLQEQAPALSKKIIGIETTDHPTDAQIATFAGRFIKAA
jgi:stalled ribosome rescue protein Dom34